MSIQFTSDDGTVTADHVLAVWSKTFIDAGEQFGKTFRIADLARGYMQDVGFQNVTERRFKLPIGPWSPDKKLRKLGRWNQIHCEQGIEGWAMALLTRVMGVSFVHYFAEFRSLISFQRHLLTCACLCISGPTRRCRSFWRKCAKASETPTLILISKCTFLSPHSLFAPFHSQLFYFGLCFVETSADLTTFSLFAESGCTAKSPSEVFEQGERSINGINGLDSRWRRTRRSGVVCQ